MATITKNISNQMGAFSVADSARGLIPAWLRSGWDQVGSDMDSYANVTSYHLDFVGNPEIGYDYFSEWLKDKIDTDYNTPGKDVLIAFKGRHVGNLVNVVYNGDLVLNFSVENDFDTAMNLVYIQAAISALTNMSESTTSAVNSYTTTLQTWKDAQ